MSDTYILYSVILFSPNSLSHQQLDFISSTVALETAERLKHFFDKEGAGITVKLFRHEMDAEYDESIDSMEIEI